MARQFLESTNLSRCNVTKLYNTHTCTSNEYWIIGCCHLTVHNTQAYCWRPATITMYSTDHMGCGGYMYMYLQLTCMCSDLRVLSQQQSNTLYKEILGDKHYYRKVWTCKTVLPYSSIHPVLLLLLLLFIFTLRSHPPQLFTLRLPLWFSPLATHSTSSLF